MNIDPEILRLFNSYLSSNTYIKASKHAFISWKT